MVKYFTIFCLAFLTQCYLPDKKVIPKPSESVKIKEGINIGDRAPDLSYPNPEGSVISLYSLRGKMVLIDFWASWCPPCRHENPNLVAIFKEFKEKNFRNGIGFTVYSVSCDRTKEEWIDAIDKDQLEWENHVSDLKGWEAEATYIYNISSIPSNFLIDSEGIILAKDLNSGSLRMFLETHLID